MATHAKSFQSFLPYAWQPVETLMESFEGRSLNFPKLSAVKKVYKGSFTGGTWKVGKFFAHTHMSN